MITFIVMLNQHFFFLCKDYQCV